MSDTTTDTASTPNPGETGSTTPTTDTTTQQQGSPATAPNGSEGGNGGDGGNKPVEGKPDGEAPTGAPEAYAAFTVPDGVEIAGERLELANTTFKGLNLNQDQAQGLIDLYVKLQGEDTGVIHQLLEDQRVQQTEQWGTDAKQQLGAQYDETVGLARTAVQHVNDPELTKVFNEQGWGNHPSLIKAFAKFGKFLRDSNVDGLGGGTSVQRSGDLATRLFGSPTA